MKAHNFSFSFFCKQAWFIAGIVLLFLSCKATQKLSEIETHSFKYDVNTLVQFIKDSKLSEVLDFAGEQNKLTFVEFYTDWCLPCSLMDESVFVEPNFSDYMNESFVNYKIDGDGQEGINLRYVFDVQEYPTFLFLDQRGRVLAKASGSRSSDYLRNLSIEAKETFQKLLTPVGE